MKNLNVSLSGITKTLEYAWSAVQKVHPEVRDAVLVVYMHPKGDRRGHWAPESWTVTAEELAGDGETVRTEDRIDEVHLSSHVLSQGGRSIMETVVHEAVHSAARSRGIKDVSRQGRWHNKKFAIMADEFGLQVQRDKKVGHRTPDLTEEAVAIYQEAIMWLNDETGSLFQTMNLAAAKPKNAANTVKLVCPVCKRYFRIGRKQLEYGAINCDPCGVEFEAEETAD